MRTVLLHQAELLKILYPCLTLCPYQLKFSKVYSGGEPGHTLEVLDVGIGGGEEELPVHLKISRISTEHGIHWS